MPARNSLTSFGAHRYAHPHTVHSPSWVILSHIYCWKPRIFDTSFHDTISCWSIDTNWALTCKHINLIAHLHHAGDGIACEKASNSTRSCKWKQKQRRAFLRRHPAMASFVRRFARHRPAQNEHTSIYQDYLFAFLRNWIPSISRWVLFCNILLAIWRKNAFEACHSARKE